MNVRAKLHRAVSSFGFDGQLEQVMLAGVAKLTVEEVHGVLKAVEDANHCMAQVVDHARTIGVLQSPSNAGIDSSAAVSSGRGDAGGTGELDISASIEDLSRMVAMQQNEWIARLLSAQHLIVGTLATSFSSADSLSSSSADANSKRMVAARRVIAHEAQVFADSANTVFASTERFAALNLNMARMLLEDTVANTRHILLTDEVSDIAGLQASLAQPTIDKFVAYSRSIAEIVVQTHEEFSKLLQARLAIDGKLDTSLGGVPKNAPAGSAIAVAAVKAAIAEANNAYDAMSKAAKQVAELNEANVASAASATAGAGGVGSKKDKSQKKNAA